MNRIIAIICFMLIVTTVFASDVLHKDTMQILEAVHTPNYINGDYIINPVLPKCNKKYWKIFGNEVLEMTVEEKVVKDAEITAKLELEIQKAQELAIKVERDRLIKERSYKIAEDQLIEEGVLEVIVIDTGIVE